MLNILLTFDYEIFFNKNFFDPQKVLFDPTDSILGILEQNSVPGTFFADVCSVFRHKDFGLDSYVQGFSRQIQDIIKRNSDVQLHIHPHWLKSNYINNDWIFPEDYYRLHDFGLEDLSTIKNILSNSIDYLNGTIKPIKPDYKCYVFRSGGYAIQPYSKLLPVLSSFGVTIDSSVSMNLINTVKNRSFDFTNLPSSLNFWLSPNRLLSDSGENRSSDFDLFEIPIGSIKRTLFNRLLFYKRTGFKKDSPRGTAMTLKTSSSSRSFKRIVMDKITGYWQLSLDSLNYKLVFYGLNRIHKKYCKNNSCYIAIIMHPKSFSGDAFSNLNSLIKCVKDHSDHFSITSFPFV